MGDVIYSAVLITIRLSVDARVYWFTRLISYLSFFVTFFFFSNFGNSVTNKEAKKHSIYSFLSTQP